MLISKKERKKKRKKVRFPETHYPFIWLETNSELITITEFC